ERRQHAERHAVGQLLGGALGDGVLLAVAARSESVLEVDAEILHRLARELLPDAVVDLDDEPRFGGMLGGAAATRQLFEDARRLLLGRQRALAHDAQGARKAER